MTIKERLAFIKDELSAITISGSFMTCSAADRVFDKLTRTAPRPPCINRRIRNRKEWKTLARL